MVCSIGAYAIDASVSGHVNRMIRFSDDGQADESNPNMLQPTDEYYQKAKALNDKFNCLPESDAAHAFKANRPVHKGALPAFIKACQSQLSGMAMQEGQSNVKMRDLEMLGSLAREFQDEVTHHEETLQSLSDSIAQSRQKNSLLNRPGSTSQSSYDAPGNHRFYYRGGGGYTFHGFRWFEGPIHNADGDFIRGEERRYFDECEVFFLSFILGKQKAYDLFFSRLEVFHEFDIKRMQYLATSGGVGETKPNSQSLITRRTGINFGLFFPVWGNTITAGPILSLYHQENRVSVDSPNSWISDTFKRNSIGGRGGFGANWNANDIINLSLTSQISSSNESNVNFSLILFFDALIDRFTST